METEMEIKAHKTDGQNQDGKNDNGSLHDE